MIHRFKERYFIAFEWFIRSLRWLKQAVRPLDQFYSNSTTRIKSINFAKNRSMKYQVIENPLSLRNLTSVFMDVPEQWNSMSGCWMVRIYCSEKGFFLELLIDGHNLFMVCPVLYLSYAFIDDRDRNPFNFCIIVLRTRPVNFFFDTIKWWVCFCYGELWLVRCGSSD